MIRIVGVTGLVLVGALCLAPATIADGQPVETKKKGFGLGLGGVYAQFDTNAKFTDKQSGYSVFVDAEGTLGLPEADTVPAVYGVYRVSRKHAFGFSYFQIRRDVTFFNDNLQVGDATISGKATLEDKTRFYHLNYNYTFFRG